MGKRLLAALALTMLLGAILPGATMASGQDSSYVVIHEYGDPCCGLGDHFTDYKVDTGNLPDLRVWNLGLFAGCDDLYDEWNNCISEIELHLKPGTCIGFFDAPNYGTLFAQYGYPGPPDSVGTGYWKGTSYDNRASSIRWGDFRLIGGKQRCVYGNY